MSEQFLIRDRGQRQKAHIWTGSDTICRMWSTGGLKRKNFSVRDMADPHDLCHMCSTLLQKERKAA